MAGWLPLFQSPFFKTVQNIGTVGYDEFNLINFFKTSDIRVANNSPTVLNDDGYIANGKTLTDNLSYLMTLPAYAGASSAKWVLKWTGTFGVGSAGLLISENITIDNLNTTGVTTISAGSTNTIIRGTNGRMEFTFNHYVPGTNNFNTYFTTGCTASGLSGMVLCRLSDETAIDGGAVWTPEFLASMTALNPGVLRLMGPTTGASGGDVVSNGNWVYRNPVTSASYNNTRPYVSGLWVGDAGGGVGVITNSAHAYTAASYTDMPGSYTDGDCFMGIVAAASADITVSAVATSSGKVKLTIPSTTGLTTGDPISYSGYRISGPVGSYCRGIWTITVLSGTQIELTTGWQTGVASVYSAPDGSGELGRVGIATMNSGGRGKRPVVGIGDPPSNGIPSSGQVTFVYKSLTKTFYAVAGGLFTGINPELVVNLCNTLNKHMWLNLNCFTTDATATSAVTYVKNNLNSNLDCVLEWSNEVFNYNFNQYFYAWDNSLALNIGNDGLDSGTCAAVFAGLRSAELFTLAHAAWSGRTASQLKPTLTHWGYGQISDVFQAHKLNGTLLNATTNPVLSAYTGGKRYDQGSPNFNRPVDQARLLSFACYPSIGGITQTVEGYITYAQQYASGATTAALDGFDAAMRTAAMGFAGPGLQYELYETMAASYDGARPSGVANLEIWMYEGGYEIAGPDGHFYLPIVPEYVASGYSLSSTITFNVGGSPRGVNWTSGTPVNGTRVSFSGGVMPTGIDSGKDYYVINSSPGVGFDIAKASGPGVGSAIPALCPALAIEGSPSGTITATICQYSIDNIVIAWLSDARAAAWVSVYCRSIAAYPHWKRIAFLQLEGFTPWSIYPSDMASTPFKIFDGLTTWNGSARN